MQNGWHDVVALSYTLYHGHGSQTLVDLGIENANGEIAHVYFRPGPGKAGRPWKKWVRGLFPNDLDVAEAILSRHVAKAANVWTEWDVPTRINLKKNTSKETGATFWRVIAVDQLVMPESPELCDIEAEYAEMTKGTR